jgi:hypothetical protein
MQYILASLRDTWKRDGWKYVEIRPIDGEFGHLQELGESTSYCLHQLDLQPSLEELFRKFHRDCIRRKIARAEREGLSYEEGRSESLLEKFHRLLRLTRRRQLSLAPPLNWFRNLIVHMGDMLKIRLAFKNGQPIAGILTLCYKSSIVYKYGCSDRQYNQFGGTPLLFWKTIQEAKLSGCRELDMGRSDWTDPGLIKFKDRWGAAQSTLTYWRYGSRGGEFANVARKAKVVRRIFGFMPDRVLASAGTWLYRHAA